MKVEIGGGTIPKPGFTNLDPVYGRGEFRRKVQDGIPLPDNSVMAMYSSHCLEHIPPGDEFIFTMNEVHRVLVPGGTFEIVVPLFGYTDGSGGHVVQGWWAIADPTHCHLFWAPESFLYFCEGPFKPNADYGISVWDILRDEDWEVRNGWEGRVLLRKPAV